MSEPKLKISALPSYYLPKITSGAAYPGVPHLIRFCLSSEAKDANPKSVK